MLATGSQIYLILSQRSAEGLIGRSVESGGNGQSVGSRPRLCDNSPALKVYGGTEESLRPGFEGKKAESITPSRS